jgi:ABC-type multidrug transport system fused ATPase/permease subunit
MFKNLKLIYRTLDNTLKVRFLKVFIFNNITVILETFGIGMLFIILNVSTSKSYYGDFYNKFIDIFSFNLKEENLILFLLIFFVIFFIIKLFFIVFTKYYEQSTMQKTEYFYIRLFLNKYFNTSILLFSSFNSAKLVTNMQKEANLFVNHIIFSYVAIVSEVFLCIMFLTFLFYINFKVTLFIIFFFIFISSFYIFFFKKKLKSIGIERQKSDVDYLKYLNESFYLIKEIKIFLLQNFLINKFNVIVFKRFKIVLQELIINQLPRLFLEFFLIVLSVIFFVYLILSNYNIMSYIALF